MFPITKQQAARIIGAETPGTVTQQMAEDFLGVPHGSADDLFPVTSEEVDHLIDTLRDAYGWSTVDWPETFSREQVAAVLAEHREPEDTVAGGEQRTGIFPIFRAEAAQIRAHRGHLPGVITQEEAARYLGTPVGLADDLFPVTGREAWDLIMLAEETYGTDPAEWPAAFSRDLVAEGLRLVRETDQEEPMPEWEEELLGGQYENEEDPTDVTPEEAHIFPLDGDDVAFLIDLLDDSLDGDPQGAGLITYQQVASALGADRSQRRSTVTVPVSNMHALADALEELSALVRQAAQG